jgi:hypothetical protein
MVAAARTLLLNSDYHNPKKKVIFFPQAKLNFFHRFLADNYDSVLSFSGQVSEIILNESSKSPKNVLIECLQKDTTKYIPKSKVNVVFW